MATNGTPMPIAKTASKRSPFTGYPGTRPSLRAVSLHPEVARFFGITSNHNSQPEEMRRLGPAAIAKLPGGKR